MPPRHKREYQALLAMFTFLPQADMAFLFCGKKETKNLHLKNAPPALPKAKCMHLGVGLNGCCNVNLELIPTLIALRYYRLRFFTIQKRQAPQGMH